MRAWRSLLARIPTGPVAMFRVNSFLATAWLLGSVPIIAFLAQSVPFLVFVSCYANVASHWSAALTARAEAKADEVIPPTP